MNLTGSRRADEFHRLLESEVRDDDPVTGPLLTLADALQAVPHIPGPRPEFRTALRQRLVAVATVQGVGATTETPIQRARAAGSTWRVQRRLSALAAGAAVVTGIAGVGVGASRSLPGQPLYGVKRAAEDAQLAATLGTEARGKRHLEFARTRLAEVQALAGTSSSLAPAAGAHAVAGALPDASGRTKLIEQTLHAMDVETRSGAQDLFDAFRATGSREPLTTLNSFSREQYSKLQSLVSSLPAPARPAATESLTLLAYVADDTVKLDGHGGTPATSPSTNPTAPSATTTPKPGKSGTPSAPASGNGATTTPTNGSSGSSQPGVGNTLQSPPSLPSIPPLPTAVLPTELPSELPSLPDITGLLGH